MFQVVFTVDTLLESHEILAISVWHERASLQRYRKRLHNFYFNSWVGKIAVETA